jgi:hypothetical protein
MLLRLAPIAAAKAQNSACAVLRLKRLMPKLSTSTKARGERIAAQPRMVGATARWPPALRPTCQNSACSSGMVAIAYATIPVSSSPEAIQLYTRSMYARSPASTAAASAVAVRPQPAGAPVRYR